MVPFALVFDEIGQLVRPTDQIRLVENSGRESTEEAQLPVFIHFAPRTEQCRARADQPPEGNEVMFVSARSVEQQERGTRPRVECVRHNRPLVRPPAKMPRWWTSP
jgi:hypothetical protein